MMRAKMTCIKIKTGDYQFDIYRIMKDHVGSRWEGFNPLTNVMVLPEFILSINVSSHFFLQWLHYIALKLLHSKDLKPPGGACVVQTTGAVFSEKESHRSLSELEKLLAACVSEVRERKKAVKKKSGKGRGIGIQPTSAGGFFSCAADVVRYGVSKGWIMPTA